MSSGPDYFFRSLQEVRVPLRTQEVSRPLTWERTLGRQFKVKVLCLPLDRLSSGTIPLRSVPTSAWTLIPNPGRETLQDGSNKSSLRGPMF